MSDGFWWEMVGLAGMSGAVAGFLVGVFAEYRALKYDHIETFTEGYRVGARDALERAGIQVDEEEIDTMTREAVDDESDSTGEWAVIESDSDEMDEPCMPGRAGCCREVAVRS